MAVQIRRKNGTSFYHLFLFFHLFLSVKSEAISKFSHRWPSSPFGNFTELLSSSDLVLKYFLKDLKDEEPCGGGRLYSVDAVYLTSFCHAGVYDHLSKMEFCTNTTHYQNIPLDYVYDNFYVFLKKEDRKWMTGDDVMENRTEGEGENGKKGRDSVHVRKEEEGELVKKGNDMKEKKGEEGKEAQVKGRNEREKKEGKEETEGEVTKENERKEEEQVATVKMKEGNDEKQRGEKEASIKEEDKEEEKEKKDEEQYDKAKEEENKMRKEKEEEITYKIIGVWEKTGSHGDETEEVEHEEICKHYSECWQPTVTLTSPSPYYKFKGHEVTAYQVTPGAEVNMTCSTDNVEQHLTCRGYNLTLTRRSEDAEQVMTSEVGFFVSDWSNASVTSEVVKCEVTWPGAPERLLASKKITVRPIDTDKPPALTLITPFPSSLTCPSSSSSFSFPSASVVYWAHPSSVLTWMHPNGTVLSEGKCEKVSKTADLCPLSELTLKVRESFDATDLGNYTLSLSTPQHQPVSISIPFSADCAPQHTAVALAGVTGGHVLINTTFTATCSTWGYPPPALVLTTCANNTCEEEKGGTVLVTSSLAHQVMKWQVRVASPALLMNLTCNATNHAGSQVSKSRQVYISDATAPDDHVSGITKNYTEGDNVTLTCQLSHASSDSPVRLTWMNGEQNLTKRQTSNRTHYLERVNLPLSPVQVTDEGLYTCVTEGLQETVKAVKVNVAAMEAPQWSANHSHNMTFDLHERETLTLNCSASGVPPPMYRWSKDGKELEEEEPGTELKGAEEELDETKGGRGVGGELNPTGGNRTVGDIDERKGGKPKGTEGKGAEEIKGVGGGEGKRGMRTGAMLSPGVLIIHKFAPEDAGVYVCDAENRAGRLMAWYRVKYAPPTTSINPAIKFLKVALVVVALLLVLLFAWCVRAQWLSYRFTLEVAREWKEGNMAALNPSLPLQEQAHLLPLKQKFEIPRHNITFDKLLGCGAFGRVYRATVANVGPGEDMIVAVKMIRARSDKTQLMALQSELKILMHIGKHVNIVNLVATCTKNLHKKDLMLVVEYCRYGNILDYVRRHRGDFVNQLTENGDLTPFASPSHPLPSSSSVFCDGDKGDESQGEVFISTDRVMYAKSNKTCAPELGGAGGGGGGGDDWSGGEQVTVPSTAYTHRGSDMTCVTLISDTHNLEGPSLPGDLDHLSRPLCSRDLICWAFQVARGMEFLAYRKVLHGDLAARNVLLTDGNVVKISDFGLAKDIYKYNNYKNYKNTPLPVKWMSVEALRDGIFSTQSDVWSYGVVLWEMFSLGQCPFPGVRVDDGFIKALERGHRMESPKYSTRTLYQVMLDCWATLPEDRPSFGDLEQRLSRMLTAGDTKYYEDLQKAVEVKEAMAAKEEAENETKQASDYLNMACNLNYANIQQNITSENEATHCTGNTDDDNDDDDAYVQINQSAPVSESTPTANQGYVTLFSIESLTVSSSREGREAGRGNRGGRGSVISRTSFASLAAPAEVVDEEVESLL